MKPRIALLADRRGWAYDRAAQALARTLADAFEFSIHYVAERPARPDCDLLHVFFWGETWHRRWGLPRERVVKEISSHRWNETSHGNLTPAEFVERHLHDAATLTATSRRLQRIVAPERPVWLAPNGVELPPSVPSRQGPLVFGWAGNAGDPCKGLRDVLVPAAGRDFPVLLAGGDVAPERMAAFYARIDALLIASTAEGEPLTLLEAMAHGCFPIATDVGIVDELVRHGDNGRVVARTPAAFRAAMQWAVCNPERVRAAGRVNHERMAGERQWSAVAPQWAAAWQAALGIVDADPGNLAQYNNGQALGQWPDRARRAAELVAALSLPEGARVLDLGCGRQTVRALLPDHVDYRPFDRLRRTEDTHVVDLATADPPHGGDLALVLGVLEYLPDPGRLLDWIARNCRRLVFSCNDCSEPTRRARQHWRATWSLEQVEQHLVRRGGVITTLQQISDRERLYVVEFTPAIVLPAMPRPAGLVPSAPGAMAPIALFSAAVAGDNSGDAWIEHAVRGLLPGRTFVRLPLVQRLDDAAIEHANGCGLGILCGTNLYQRTFASGLDLPTLRRLRIPLLPLGIGGSSAPGEPIAMDAAGVAIVRALHERCALGSVRDPQALQFVHGLGIRNVELTGCPVLFSGSGPPQFIAREGELAVSLRARLLHVADDQGVLAEELFDRLCAATRPLLVLQSPYDLPLAERLARRHRLEIIADRHWQADALIAALPRVRATIGLRLHWNMACLAHGIPAVLLGTDTRTQSFCAMTGLPFVPLHDAATRSTADLLRGLTDEQRFGRMVARWQVLRRAMESVLAAHGLGASAPVPESVEAR